MKLDRILVWISTLSLMLLSVVATGNDVENGQLKYEETCIACHGAKGKSDIPGVPDFRKKNGPLSKGDSDLMRSIIEGVERSGADMTMPPMGGNPNLTMQDIADLIAYMKVKFQVRP